MTCPRSHQLSPVGRSPVAFWENPVPTAVSYSLGTLCSHIPSYFEVSIKKDLAQCFPIIVWGTLPLPTFLRSTVSWPPPTWRYLHFDKSGPQTRLAGGKESRAPERHSTVHVLGTSTHVDLDQWWTQKWSKISSPFLRSYGHVVHLPAHWILLSELRMVSLTGTLLSELLGVI